MTQETEIRRALAKITSSEAFVASPRIVDFLTYVVEETLAGRQELIKAKTIAMDVYGRSMEDDLQTNLVRVDAGRLRRMLDDFYLNEKESSSLRINVPKGTYVPEFETMVPGTTLKETASVASIQYSSGTSTFFLSKTGIVIGLIFALFVVGSILFFGGPKDVSDSTETMRRAAERTAIFDVSPARLQSVTLVDQARYLIFPAFDPVRLQSSLSLFERAFELDPYNSDALAGLALMTSMKGFMLPPSDARNQMVDQGLLLSDEAIVMAPSSSWTQIAKAWSLFVAGSHDEAIDYAEASAHLAPNDSTIQDFQGIIYLFTGRFKEAIRVCDPELDGLPYDGRSPRINALGAAHFQLENYQSAIVALQRSVTDGAPVSSVASAFLAASYEANGQSEEGRRLADEIKKAWPNVDVVSLTQRLFAPGVDMNDFIFFSTKVGL
ncbi:tetratricopeptide repeat protein [Falsiruegeria mediterranea]